MPDVIRPHCTTSFRDRAKQNLGEKTAENESSRGFFWYASMFDSLEVKVLFTT